MSTLACPELDKWIDVYTQLADDNHSLNLLDIEKQLESCLAQERLDEGNPYPETSNVQITIIPNQTVWGPSSISGGENFKVWDESDDSEKVVDDNTFYIYVKRDPCPYLEKARHLLHTQQVQERQFRDDAVAFDALPDHSEALVQAQIQTQRQGQPLSSPQIFKGATFIPGGASGLEQYLKLLYSTSSPTSWFVYGSIKCKYCKQAMDILGELATFVELYEYDEQGNVVREKIVQLDPAHARLVESQNEIARLEREISELRRTEGVPIMYNGTSRFPNNFVALKQTVDNEYRNS